MASTKSIDDLIRAMEEALSWQRDNPLPPRHVAEWLSISDVRYDRWRANGGMLTTLKDWFRGLAEAAYEAGKREGRKEGAGKTKEGITQLIEKELTDGPHSDCGCAICKGRRQLGEFLICRLDRR